MDITFQVTGMTCSHCEMTVKKAIKRLDAEANVEIDGNTGKVDIHSNKSREELARAITEEGYQVT
jgi:copper chaperone